MKLMIFMALLSQPQNYQYLEPGILIKRMKMVQQMTRMKDFTVRYRLMDPKIVGLFLENSFLFEKNFNRPWN